jgi:hypothetical protein
MAVYGPGCPLCVIRKSLARQCFESLENKMSSGRCASLNEGELDQITDFRLSQNTKNATKYAVKTFSLYSKLHLGHYELSVQFYQYYTVVAETLHQYLWWRTPIKVRLSQNTKNATKYAVKTFSLLTIFLFHSDVR